MSHPPKRRGPGPPHPTRPAPVPHPDGQPEDVISFAAFLCSDAASHLSGTLLPIRPVTG